jgi:MOSC domain-containing protein YiiM/GNAT superfamily N-acetyltransferase
MSARVVQVNVSPGGVPKRAVEGPVRVDWLGLEGDGHHDDTVHGGPNRAVCLYGIEAIGRVAAEGHPIFPGSCGDNLTTKGIELSTLPVGTRLAIGDRLLLELAAPDGPCETIEESFTDSRFSRINIDLHPTDSRMYARVLAEGEVRAGDPITVLPPPDSSGEDRLRLIRFDQADRAFQLANWRASLAAGLPLEIVDDGELAMVACPTVPGSWRNRALGLDGLPNLLDRAIAFFAEHGVTGTMSLSPEVAGRLDIGPEPDDPGSRSEILAAAPDDVGEAGVEGVTIRRIGAAEAPAWIEAALEADDIGPPERPWIAAAGPYLLGISRQAHRRLFVAEEQGRIVGTAALFTRHKTGLLAAAAVRPDARGRGIQRALISARAREAEALGCQLVVTEVDPGSVSARNQRSSGLTPIATRIRLPVPVS